MIITDRPDSFNHFSLLESSPVYLVASDFDKTLSFNDSGLVLSELMGVQDFEAKVAGLAQSNLVQQGAELAYLLRHDPSFRPVRREHLYQAGKLVSLKHHVELLARMLKEGWAAIPFTSSSSQPDRAKLSAPLWRGSCLPRISSARSLSGTSKPAKSAR